MSIADLRSCRDEPRGAIEHVRIVAGGLHDDAVVGHHGNHHALAEEPLARVARELPGHPLLQRAQRADYFVNARDQVIEEA